MWGMTLFSHAVMASTEVALRADAAVGGIEPTPSGDCGTSACTTAVEGLSGLAEASSILGATLAVLIIGVGATIVRRIEKQ